jgi:hypothetical protein
MYDSPYNNKTFPLIYRIIALSLVIALGCIGYPYSFIFSSSWPRITIIPKALKLVCRMKTLLN